MKNIYKYIGAGFCGALLLTSGIGMGFALDKPEPKIEVKEIEVPVLNTEIVEVEKEVEKEVIKEVDVNERMMENFIFDHDGDLELLMDDLDEEDTDQISDRIAFIIEAKKLAADAVNEEAKDLLHKEEIGEEKLDRDDIERLRIDDDFDEIEMDDVDFDYKDAEFFIHAKFKHDDVDYEADFVIEMEDNKVVDVDLDAVYEAE